MLHTPKLSSQRVLVLGNKAHETSASWNRTLFGYMPEMSWEFISIKIIRKNAKNYTNILGEFHLQLFCDKSTYSGQPTVDDHDDHS